MNTLLSLKCLRLLPLIAVALLLAHSTAFATPDGNTSFGVGALPGNTTGRFNSGFGYNALDSNSSGSYNTATGDHALFFNTIGTENVADGHVALQANTTGSGNSAFGVEALIGNTTGSRNIALGYFAGRNLTTGDNNIDIGNSGVAGESSTIRIGDYNHTRTFVAGISGVAISGAGVLINASGQLGVAVSSARFKDEIKPMDKASEVIFSLKPVSFRYKNEIDHERLPQFGLVAEDVEKINPKLVVRDAEGKPFTVRYDAVNAMLLNEFLKEHRKVEEQNHKIQEQEATITQLKKDMETVIAHLQEQDSKIQKVRDQVELNRPVPQLVSNATLLGR
jgi:trimeric autotransporter adhesin